MKLSIFPRFGAQNSKPVFAAFVEGATKAGHTIVEHDMSADVYVIWSVLWSGRMLANQAVWKDAQKSGKPVVVLEVGGIQRGTTWKIGLNHINNNGFFGSDTDITPGRAKKLGVVLAPWSTTGDHILICGQHTKSQQWQRMPPPDKWLDDTINQVKIHSDRPIIFRPHPRDWQWATECKHKDVKIKIPKKIDGTYDDFDFSDDVKNAWAVINPSSNTGILSILQGVPAFVTSHSLAAPVGNLSFETLNNPLRPQREDWLEWYCHTEWTLDEIASGTPISRIFSSKI